MGASPAGPLLISLLALLFLLLGVLGLYTLWRLWPSTGTEDAAASSEVGFLWWTFSASREQVLQIIVAALGALGALLHGIRSFARYVGERLLYRSWLLFYLMLPLVGAIIAIIVYLVLRAGLVGAGQITDTNLFGFAAVSALVGLFSAQAAEKLKEVFETIFTKTEPGADSLEQVGLPTITGFRPQRGKPSDPITIRGSGFDRETQVFFGEVRAESVEFISDKELKAKIPEDVGPGKVRIMVQNQSGAGIADSDLEVTSA